MLSEVTIGGAFLAGLISFLSPCVLPLVPPYLCYMAGVSLDQLAGASPARLNRRTVALASISFVLGFSTVFVALGVTASAVGQLVRTWWWLLTIVGGATIIVMGLHFLGVFRIPFLYREARFHIRRPTVGIAGSYLMGLAFGFGWTPCIGPVLGVILGIAGTRDTLASGAGLLAVYSLGLGVPFIVAGLFAGSFMAFAGRFRAHIGKVEKAMGALLVATGILFVTGQVGTIANWLMGVFPSLAAFG